MPTSFMVVLSSPLEGKEEEFDEWYERHVREVLTIPGFIAGQRFVAPAIDLGLPSVRPPLTQQHMVMWEIEGDPEAAMEALRQVRVAKTFPVPHVFDIAETLTTVYTTRAERVVRD